MWECLDGSLWQAQSFRIRGGKFLGQIMTEIPQMRVHRLKAPGIVHEDWQREVNHLDHVGTCQVGDFSFAN